MEFLVKENLSFQKPKFLDSSMNAWNKSFKVQINKKCNAIYQGAFKVYKLNWNFKDYPIVIKIYSLLFGTDFFPVLKLRLLVEVVMMSGGMSDMAGEGVTCMLWVMQAGMSPVRLWDRLGGMSPTPFMLDVSPEKQNWHLAFLSMN